MAGKGENRSPINTITRKQGNTRHRVRLGAPSGTWRRLCDGGASPTLRTAPSPCGGGLGWGLPAYRRCPVAIPVSFQNFRVRVGYAATHPTHEIRHRVRLGAPSGAWRRLCDGGASPTLRTARRSPFMADIKNNVGHECPTYNFPLNRPSPRGGGLGWGLPAYRRCPVAIPVKKTNFGAPSGVWRRLCDGGASPTLRTVRRSAIYGRQQKNVGHECPTYNLLSEYPPNRSAIGCASAYRPGKGADWQFIAPEPGQAAPPARNFVNIAIQCPESHDKRSSA